MLLIAKRYASYCVFIGDRPEDYYAAIAANIPFILAEIYLRTASKDRIVQVSFAEINETPSVRT